MMTDWSQAKNMAQLLEQMEQQAGDRVILKYMHDREVLSMTGSVFFDRARRCGAHLFRQGLAGKHIGIMGANRWQWMAYLCGIFQIDGVAVLLSPDLNLQELKDRVQQCDITAIVSDANLLEMVSAAGVPVWCMDDPLPEAHIPECAKAQPEELACILVTSGTTARCRAVAFSHRAVIAGICHNVISLPFESHLAILPMHHIAGFASVLNTWYLGRVVCLGEQVKWLYRYLEKMKADYVLTVPAILQAIVKKLKNAGPNGTALGWNLRLVGCGGAQFPPDVIRELQERNIRVLQSYGATEVGGIGFDWEMTPDCAGSIGKPCPQMDVRIVDGELYLRCDSMMSGYYKDPELTDRTIIDGWYATGDLCRMDEDGYLYLRGRKTNVIILSNGENVSPEEIEAALLHQGLPGEVLVGVDKGLITAWIYPEHDGEKETAEACIRRYNGTVPRYKQIQNLLFVTKPFEKTAVGKVKRMGFSGG